MIHISLKIWPDTTTHHIPLVPQPSTRPEKRLMIPAGAALVHGYLTTTSLVEAETQYLALCRVRTDRPGIVKLDPGLDHMGIIAPAAYRTDRAWRGWREQEEERRRQVWASPPDWTGPTTDQARSLSLSAGISQQEMARRIGREPAKVRQWLAGRTRQPWPTWCAALVVCGLMPDLAHLGPPTQ